MKNLITSIHQFLDLDWLTEHTKNLYRFERRQTFPAYAQAAKYAYDLLKQEGFDAEILETPADGRTTYQDKCSPIGWDVSNMKLTVVTPIAGLSDPVVSDYNREPLTCVKHSVSTPPEGLTTRLFTESQMKAGVDVRGAFVLLSPMTRPRGAIIKMLLDLGAVGWVSDYLEDPDGTPDCVSWINAGTENNSWHVQAEDRDFIGYQITPHDGRLLRQACENGKVFVHAQSDARRYETTISAVTAVLPGNDPREIWLNAHLYEPLIDDNSNGVIACIAVLKYLRELSKKRLLKYSVRVVFAGEMYGFAAVADHFGGVLEDKTIGAIVFDGVIGQEQCPLGILMIEAPDYYSHNKPVGYAGNILLHAITEAAIPLFPQIELTPMIHDHLGDDCFLGDASVGMPTVWPRHSKGGLHHNSFQDETKWEVNRFAAHLAISGAWVCAMAASTEEEILSLLPGAIQHAGSVLAEAAATPIRHGEDPKARMEALLLREQGRIRGLHLWSDDPAIDQAADSLQIPALPPVLPAPEAVSAPDYAPNPGSWYAYGENFVFTRLQVGLPHDLVKLPFNQRFPMPGSILYSDLANVVSRMDGKKTFREIVRDVEWDLNTVLDEATIRSYLHTCTKLADAGYFGMEVQNPLDASVITKALQALGVKEGDTLLVHSGLSNLGYIPGGGETAIQALKAAVGETGTFLVPAFTRPYVAFEGAVNTDFTFRPYDVRPDGALRDRSVYTGMLPRAVLAHPDVCRSGHPTHEWAALGAEAARLVAGHGFLEPPACANSPMKKALDNHGSVVFLGCDIKSNTFLHLLEDIAGVSYLKPGIFKYVDEDGQLHTALMERHLPGHRSFYEDLSNNSFYEEAIRRGLKIHTQRLGMTTICQMELDNLHDVVMQMLREDPYALLCKDPECSFCRFCRK